MNALVAKHTEKLAAMAAPLTNNNAFRHDF
jgi:hypothetical protein